MAVVNENNQEGLNQETPKDQNQGVNWDFSTFKSLSSMPIIASSGSELLNTAHVKLEKVFEKLVSDFPEFIRTNFFKMDRDINKSISHSLLVVTMANERAPEMGVSYHAILLEGSAPDREPYSQNNAGLNIEIRPVISDAVNDRLRVQIEQEVTRRSDKNMKVRSAEVSLLPKFFDLDDEGQSRRLVANALLACRNILAASAKNWTDINASRDIDRPNLLASRVTFNRNGDQPLDDAGIPVRNDVRIDLTTQEINNQNEQRRAEHLTTVGGFIDLIYAPQQQVQMAPGPFGYQQPSFQPAYRPRFVMTVFDSPRDRSIGTQLLALVNATMLYHNNIALASLLPNTSLQSKEREMHDVGALNHETPVVQIEGGYVDLRSDKVGPAEVTQYIQSQIQSTFDLAMDMSYVGSDTWVRSPFAAAASGDKRAMTLIYEAANTLTNGVFNSVVQNMPQSVATLDILVPLGRYRRDSNSGWRDLRDIDYLAVATQFCATNLMTLQQWSDARSNPHMDPLVSLYHQRRIIESMVTDVQYVGLGQRIVFDPNFINALAISAAKAGIAMTLSQPNMSQTQQRYIPTIPAMTVNMGQAASGLMNSPYMNQGNTQWGQNQQFGRFYRG